MATATPIRPSADQTIKRISAEYEALSKQLKVIALHIENRRSGGDFFRHWQAQRLRQLPLIPRTAMSGF